MPLPPVQAAFPMRAERQSNLYANPFGLPEDNSF